MQPRQKDLERAEREGMLDISTRMFEVAFVLMQMSNRYISASMEILEDFNLTRGEIKKLWSRLNQDNNRLINEVLSMMKDDTAEENYRRNMRRNIEDNLLPVARMLGFSDLLYIMSPAHNPEKYMPPRDSQEMSVKNNRAYCFLSSYHYGFLQEYSKKFGYKISDILSELTEHWIESKIVKAELNRSTIEGKYK